MSPVPKAQDDAKAMPPPPLPVKQDHSKILQPEFEALVHCLKDAIIKTGQIYGFYAETQKLGVRKYVQNPPQSLTTALGRDIERYDQLCDSIDVQLHQAISVLRRDLQQEEEKKQEEKRKAEENLTLQPPPEPMTEATTVQASDTETVPKSSPVSLLGRRQSTVSISSLHRPQAPPKLDLSSSYFKFTEDEASTYQKDLGSPVTLAPKSARAIGPNEYTPDLMAAFSNSPMQSEAVRGPPSIDLTMTDGLHMAEDPGLMGLGDSSDRPIELDLDIDIDMNLNMTNMGDLFGDADARGEADDGLYSPLGKGEGDQLPKDVLTDFPIDSSHSAELFRNFTVDERLERGNGNGKNLSSSEGFEFDISNFDSGFFPGASDAPLDFSSEVDSVMNTKINMNE